MNDKPKPSAKPAARPAAAAQQPAKAMANANAAQAQRAAALSNIVALMIRDPKFRVMKIADLEWLVMPAILSGQWQLAQGTTPAGEKKEGAPAPGRMFPVAAALWARVSPAVDARLSSNLDKPMMLKPQEWTSGDIVWIIAVPGQAQYLKKFLQHLQSSVFKGRTVKIRSVANGKPAVRTLDDLLGKSSVPTKGK